MEKDAEGPTTEIPPKKIAYSTKTLALATVVSLLIGLAGGVTGGYLYQSSHSPGSAPTNPAVPGPAPEVAPVNNIVRNASDVPAEITRNVSATVNVYLEALELNGQTEPGTSYTYWTFNGTVPGPFLRARVNDTVVVHFSNAASDTMTHSVDFHAVIGPGGGMGADMAAPGKSAVFTFKAMVPGLFVYHCGTPDASEHIANGMFGMILVQPAVSLPSVDQEFYVMQSELYTQWSIHTPGNQRFDMQHLLNETPTYFVFNGAYRALTGSNQLHATVNQTVRIYFGNAGPNFISSFHVIGEIMERVWQYGDLSDPPMHGVQTVVVPAGDSAVVDLKTLYPGNYNLVDHDLTRAVDLGALGILNVTGWANHTLYNPSVKISGPLLEKTTGSTTITLYGSMSGWGYGPKNISAPGPTLQVRPGEIVTLKLYSEDGITHNWFMDPSGSYSASSGDPVSPDFSSSSQPVIYTFTAPAQAGTWAYRCAYHPTLMYGSIEIGNRSGVPPASSTTSSALIYLGIGIVTVVVAAVIVLYANKGSGKRARSPGDAEDKGP